MENVSKIWLGPLPADSPYVKPFRMYYIQNGVEKNWDLLKVHDSVAIILYNSTRQKLVLVRQFRPAVYHGVIASEQGNFDNVDLQAFPPSIGVTLELCAGIVDKSKSWVEIAREEVLEECGFDVPVERIEEVMVYRSGVGASGAKQAMYYCEVSDADKANSGGGVDDEIIEVVELSLDEAKRMLQKGAVNNSPPSCLMGLLWFFANKAPVTV
ncbi:uridine diphosphate glucose pyrophosphatase-like [Drosophila persimilis]|uniref:Uridine diphosphate glucose pyrophosphatase NUDT14 n=2 Tax=pseudoobscura subgroup TaxID=32358 RepID=A0A6I8V2K1_DROPS|nr:uridine diphosphate glucose pyrophosphatase NUDT14 [Drosophila pseudoobscura]XP_026844628.1 uridine diphosphate glucose pyrophosphatase-like [Drosophila persimilis]